MIKIKAFSLTELMVVVAIAAIIAAVATPNYKAYLNRAKVSNMISTIEPCKIQVYQAFIQTGTFPDKVSCHNKTLTSAMSTSPLKDEIYAAYTVASDNSYVEFTLKSDITLESSNEKANLYIKLAQTGATTTSGGGDLVYSCGILGHANPMPTKYLPSGCNTP